MFTNGTSGFLTLITTLRQQVPGFDSLDRGTRRPNTQIETPVGIQIPAILFEVAN